MAKEKVKTDEVVKEDVITTVVPTHRDPNTGELIKIEDISDTKKGEV
jgi:hypothetical protein